MTGTWLEGLGEDVQHEAEGLCHVLTSAITDAALSLLMFEAAACRSREGLDRQTWEQEREAERAREEELAAQEPPPSDPAEYAAWRMKLYEQAKRDVVRAKFAAGQLPREYRHRLPFLHARTFLTSLAQINRALIALAELDIGGSQQKIDAARVSFEAAIPGLKNVRDSIEHAEDRMRGMNRKRQKMTLAPITNSAIHAPGGGVLVGDMLNGRHFGCTTEDGSYQEVEVSDQTLEAARVAVQDVLDALPWKSHGYPRYIPSR